MPIRFIDRYKAGFQVIVEANEGFLLGGRTVSDGPVFDRFFDAFVLHERGDREQRESEAKRQAGQGG
jgi:hypothetical protein